jgi:predicted dehydrogenase
MMKKMNLGIVGAGLIWEKSHKQVLKMLDDRFVVKAFSVKHDSTRSKLSKEFPESETFLDYHEMFKLKTVDAVVVLTPIALNARITIDALLAGKHVFTEKPLATSIEDLQRIIELEKTQNRKVFVLEQFRYRPSLAALKSIIDSGEIGNVVSYELVNHGKIDQFENSKGGYGKTDWRIRPEFPLGTLFDAGIHTATQLSYLFPKIVEAYALGSKIRSGFGRYDQITMMFSHLGGVHGTFSFSGYLDDGVNYFIIRGTEGTILFKENRLEVKGKNPTKIEFPSSNETLEMWRLYADWFESKNSIVYGSSESLEDVQVLLAVDASLRTGRKVVL